MADPGRSSERRRRALFRRMERIFVYGPPIAIAFITIFASVFLATFAPIRGTTFWQRWALSAFIIFVVPLVAYLVRRWWVNR